MIDLYFQPSNIVKKTVFTYQIQPDIRSQDLILFVLFKKNNSNPVNSVRGRVAFKADLTNFICLEDFIELGDTDHMQGGSTRYSQQLSHLLLCVKNL